MSAVSFLNLRARTFLDHYCFPPELSSGHSVSWWLGSGLGGWGGSGDRGLSGARVEPGPSAGDSGSESCGDSSGDIRGAGAGSRPLCGGLAVLGLA